MTQNSQHNADDQDRLIARFLDREADKDPGSEREEKSRKDPLYHFLKAYKSNVVLKKEAESDTLPDIRTESASVKSRKILDLPQKNRIFQLYPAFLKIAAILLIILFVWLLFFLKDDPPAELLVESMESKKEWLFDDQSKVFLRPYSKLYRIADVPVTDHYRIEGEGYFDLVPDEDRLFFVDAGEGRVQVAGTRFSLSTWGETTRLVLEQGSVIFSHVDGSQETVLYPGQQSTEQQGRISEPEPVSPELRLGWINDELRLDRRPLSDIISEVEHHFRITVSVAPELKDERLSGTLVLDESESVLDDLAATMGASVQKVSDDHYQLRP